MGVLDEIRDRRVDMSERVQFVDSRGGLLAELPDSEFNDSPDDTEIPREDLAHVLRAALDPATTLRFGESIAELDDDGDGVDVQFVSGERQRYDIVVGADGMHSATRHLIFGPEDQFLRHLGLYVALTDLPDYAQPDRRNPMYNFPGHVIGIAAYRDKALGVFMFAGRGSTTTTTTWPPRSGSCSTPSPATPSGRFPICSTPRRATPSCTSTRSAKSTCRPGTADGWCSSEIPLTAPPAVRSRHESGHDRRLAARRGIG